MKYLFYIVTLLLFINGSTGCKKEYVNPNEPVEEEVYSTVQGMTGVIVGIKNRYAVNNLGPATVYQSISANGLTSGELIVNNAGNADLAQLLNGGNNVSPANGVLGSLWTTTNIVNNEAQKLIDNAENIAEVNTKNAIKIYGHLYKSMAIGTLAMFWEQVPIITGPSAQFKTRQEALQTAVQLLDEASTLLQSTTLPADFLRATGAEIDLKNTLPALSARYNMMLLNNDQAIEKASAVDLSKKSIFFYNNTNPNPVFRSGLVSANVVSVKPDLGLPSSLAANPADKRVPFYTTKNMQNGSGFFQGDASPIPIYIPGEMLLIQAEAYARKNDLPKAVEFLNKVLTKKPADDPYLVGAELPAYSGPMTQDAILQEIYRNRLIELYMFGMRLEDSRRFNRPGPGAAGAERTRNFYPYPQQERDGNSNTPQDPDI
jgi:starch-binding outer membrane protein, SusD/RagB family